MYVRIRNSWTIVTEKRDGVWPFIINKNVGMNFYPSLSVGSLSVNNSLSTIDKSESELLLISESLGTYSSSEEAPLIVRHDELLCQKSGIKSTRER